MKNLGNTQVYVGYVIVKFSITSEDAEARWNTSTYSKYIKKFWECLNISWCTVSVCSYALYALDKLLVSFVTADISYSYAEICQDNVYHTQNWWLTCFEPMRNLHRTYLQCILTFADVFDMFQTSTELAQHVCNLQLSNNSVLASLRGTGMQKGEKTISRLRGEQIHTWAENTY